MMRPRLCFAFCFLFSCLHAAPQSLADAEDSRRIDQIHSLGLASLPGKMPTFYSPGASARAEYLQSLLGGEIAYFAKLFHIHFAPLNMAVLDAAQWPLVAGQDPYGMPLVGGSKPSVFVMPGPGPSPQTGSGQWKNVGSGQV
jgi:hypothetical protein